MGIFHVLFIALNKMFVFMSCLFLSEASEKMLKAWQENEERAAAFAQVMPLFKKENVARAVKF